MSNLESRKSEKRTDSYITNTAPPPHLHKKGSEADLNNVVYND